MDGKMDRRRVIKVPPFLDFAETGEKIEVGLHIIIALCGRYFKYTDPDLG